MPRRTPDSLARAMGCGCAGDATGKSRPILPGIRIWLIREDDAVVIGRLP
jgi:hypothetical protein